MDYFQESLKKHQQYKGKLEITSKVPLETKEDLSLYYTPWVAEPCREITKNPEKVYDYTRKNNTIAIISDGTAVLGLGNIGPKASLPVMEWKALLLKKFWNINAVPIVVDTKNPDEIIKIAEQISPGFGGIFLEDIKAPDCFYIEDILKKTLDIPVFHDDQHGTAIVVLAGMINSLKITNKKIKNIKIVMTWAGAAWIACAKLLIKHWAQNIIMFDSKWTLNNDRKDLNKYKQQLVKYNKNNEKWTLWEVLKGADVFIWVSQPGLVSKEMVQTMNSKSIIFAMANPTPEITPEEAKAGWAYIIATWRSDFPNQINNVLAFPGLRKWVMKARIPQITEEHKITTAIAIANHIQNPTPDHIIPSTLDLKIADIIAETIIS